MAKLQIPAVTRPDPASARHHQAALRDSIPQTTLAGPPDGRLRDKLADKAVHDYPQLVSANSQKSRRARIHTFRMANARPSIDLQMVRQCHAARRGIRSSCVQHRELTLQLGLVAHLGQLGIIIVVSFHHDGCSGRTGRAGGEKKWLEDNPGDQAIEKSNPSPT